MKNFSFKTKKNSPHSSADRSLIKIGGYVLIALIAVVLLRIVMAPLLSDGVMGILSLRTYLETSTATFPSYFRERGALQGEIERLTEELSRRSGDRSTITRIAAENDELRSLMKSVAEERILAGVIARPPSVPYDLLVIDRGSAHGIEIGAVVYQAENHAIGLVSRVYDKTSLVTLFSSSGAETSVYIYGPDIFAYAYGEGGGVMRISVPQGIVLSVGDAVVLPSIEGGDVGVIERVVSVPTQPEQSAYVTFPIGIQSMRSVTVSRTVTPPVPFEELVTNVELIRERFRVALPEVTGDGSGTSTGTTTQEAATST